MIDLILPSDNAASSDLFADDDRVVAIRRLMMPLLAYQIERFTMGASTSVPVETARQLLCSIIFTSELYMRYCLIPHEAGNLFRRGDKEDMLHLLNEGRAVIDRKVAEGKALLTKILALSPYTGSISYADTIKELGSFFRRYDRDYFAAEIPCSIDYQLSHPVPDHLPGIEYVNEYLRRLAIENEFCGGFDPTGVTSLLRGFNRDYKTLLINIYEPVMANAAALCLLQRNILSLEVTESDRSELISLLKPKTASFIDSRLPEISDEICRILDISDDDARAYHLASLKDIFTRVIAVLSVDGSLAGIFPSALPCVDVSFTTV